MDEYKPNSHKSKEDEKDKKVEKVVNGLVKKKKKNGAEKLASTFLSEDVGSVKTYIFRDILVPAIKKAISDIFSNGIDMLLYGESGNSKKKNQSSYVSYKGYYDDKSDANRFRENRRRTSYSFDEIIIDNRGEAEEVLSRMDELIDLYGSVSVADFYDLVGVTCEYTANKYGWTDIRSAYVERTRNGYIIKLPKARLLN